DSPESSWQKYWYRKRLLWGGAIKVVENVDGKARVKWRYKACRNGFGRWLLDRLLHPSHAYRSTA
ncbi:MAG: hypothetical protein ACKO8U_18490, partial [Pirellula sp.]